MEENQFPHRAGHAEQVQDLRQSTAIAKEHIAALKFDQERQQMLALNPDYDNFNREKNEGQSIKKLLDMSNVRGNIRKKLSNQPVQYKSERDKQLFGPEKRLGEKNRKQVVKGRAKNFNKKQSELNIADDYSEGFGTEQTDTETENNYERFIKVDAQASPPRQARFVTLAAPISRNDLNDQITKFRESVRIKQEFETDREKLKKDFNGLGVNQLNSVEKELKYASNMSFRQRNKRKNKRSLDTTGDNTLEVYHKKLRDSSLQTSFLNDIQQRTATNFAYKGDSKITQVETASEENFAPEARFKTAIHRPREPSPGQDFGQRKVSSTTNKHGFAQSKNPQFSLNQNHATQRRMFQSKLNAKSMTYLDPISKKQIQAQNDPYMVQKKAGALTRVQSTKGFSRRDLPNRQLASANTSRPALQNQGKKRATHMEKVLSQITLFKKKMDIDDEQNRLGPNNKVNMPEHSTLYFNTNPGNLHLQGQLKLDDSSDSSEHSFRSKKAQNDLAMSKPHSPHAMGRNKSLGVKMPQKDAERLLRVKSMAPVKDWTSTVASRIQNQKYGVETTKKHYEREAVAKYIYNKFGVHLLTFNHQTRNEAIPMFGEHIRQTNVQVFDEDKNNLQNRKASAMRSHFVSLKKDLKKQNLPMPNQLKGVDNERFVRKKVMEEHLSVENNDEYYLQESEKYSNASPSYDFKSLARANSQAHGFMGAPMIAPVPAQLQSHRSQAKFQLDYSDEYDVDITYYLPQRPQIDTNMENLEWQRTALKMSALRDLYAAKCRDLRIEKDANQFEKFCTHVISKAKRRTLNLSNCYFKENSARVLARSFMMYNHMVASYDLSFNELGDNGVAIIADALFRTSHIIYLNLDMNSIQWEGIQYLSKALCVNDSLIDLSLSSGKSGGNNRNRVMEKGAYELAEALSVNRFLLILNLTGNAIGNEGLSYLLPAIAQSDTLISLNLTSNEITGGQIRQVTLRDKMRQGFTSRKVRDSNFKSLAPFKKGIEDPEEKKRYKFQTAYLIQEFLVAAKSLKELNLKSNKIGDDGMIIISKAFAGHHLSKLELLDLTQTNMTAESFRVMTNTMRGKQNLSTLILDKNNLGTTYSFSTIAHIIATGHKLKVISMKSCNLNDMFGVPFSEALKSNRGLVRFNFYDNELTSRTLVQLAHAIKETQGSLKEFNLGKNNFNDKGGVKLGEAIRYNRSISKMNLSDNNFTDETALAINRNLLDHKMLEEVNLSKNLINLRIIEILEATCAKIKELKVRQEPANQHKIKQDFKQDRKDAMQTQENLQEAHQKKLKVVKMHQGLKMEGKRQENRYAGIMMKLESQLDDFKAEMRYKKNFEDEIIQMLTLQHQDHDIYQRSKEGEIQKQIDQNKQLKRDVEKAEEKLELMKQQNQEKLDTHQGELNAVLRNLEHRKKVHVLKEKEFNTLKENIMKFGQSSPLQRRRTTLQRSSTKSARSSTESPSRVGPSGLQKRDSQGSKANLQAPQVFSEYSNRQGSLRNLDMNQASGKKTGANRAQKKGMSNAGATSSNKSINAEAANAYNKKQSVGQSAQKRKGQGAAAASSSQASKKQSRQTSAKVN